MSVRVRFAPSPTGRLHIGALRTALFDHLFAARHGGVNILRIEDTDRTRYSAEAEAEFIQALDWVGVRFHEGPHVGGPCAPYHQSQRKEAGIYAREIAKLLESGHAYKAFDTPEELEQMREYQQINRQPIGYFGGRWRDATPQQVEQAEKAGKPYVIRLRVPRGQKIAIQDAIRGRIEWNADDVDDPVLIKADGMPTYHFAAMVDDHLMGITHVLRGEEWISSAPKHQALFDAFGWEAPVWVHVPVIKGTDGKKLSKRHGATSVLDYRSAGYLPEAIVNFIALLGWAPGGDRELMTPAELAEAFDIRGLQPSSAVFDIEKLNWMNGHYIRQLSVGDLVGRVSQWVALPETRAYWTTEDAESGDAASRQKVWRDAELLKSALRHQPKLAEAALALEQERVRTLAEFPSACAFFFVEEVEFDEKAVAKWFGHDHVRQMFADMIAWCDERAACTVEECEALLRGYAGKLGLEKLGPVVHPVRVALTGKTVGPGLFELMSVLGPATMATRFQNAISRLPAP
ncbi:MAG: glutamate--tRNA ligase [Fimbriimonadaceae bacterium]